MSPLRSSDSHDQNKSILGRKKWRTRRDLKWSPRSNTFGHFSLPFCLLSLVILKINARPTCPGRETSEDNDITCDIVRDILDTHNRMRQSIAEGSINAQPPAANMRELYWDSELASGAQDWANQCIFGHNDPKDREVARFPVGQNIGLAKTTKITRRNRDAIKIDFPKQIHNWFNEHNVYRFDAIGKQTISAIGHYTQVAWATTYLIGCGYSHYETPNRTIFQLYVCNYGPAGNVIGAPPYIVGKRNCDRFLEASNVYPNLCGMKNASTSCSEGSKDLSNDKKNTASITGRKFLSNTQATNRKKRLINIIIKDTIERNKGFNSIYNNTHINYKYFMQQNRFLEINL